jgi:5-methylthioadenosine/S-adenosylhomocysteine deaminase
MAEVIIRGGQIVTMDPAWNVVEGDVACRDGELVQVGGRYFPTENDYEILDAEGCAVIPGLVQSHIHMCQTLARGRADDLELLPWLRDVVWPYEAALSAEDMAASAKLACAELLLGGTTAILDMGTVRHTEQLFAAARDAGLRATIGKVMMDERAPDIPGPLQEDTRASLDESHRLRKEWHERSGGRLRYAYAPRFAISCTRELLEEVARAAREAGVRIHTHASENREEIAVVEEKSGLSNIEYLHEVGLTGEDVCLAHCVWLNDHEREILRDTGTHVLHCPSSNLKLGSGVAEIPELMEQGISVSIGADGAPCNNNLDGFMEMRLAALIHKPRRGPKAMHASQVLKLATLGGARALGLQDDIGSLEVGKRADITVVDLSTTHAVPTANPYSAIVYAARASDVRHTVVDGAIVVRDRHLLTLDRGAVIDEAKKRASDLFARLRATR